MIRFFTPNIAEIMMGNFRFTYFQIENIPKFVNSNINIEDIFHQNDSRDATDNN